MGKTLTLKISDSVYTILLKTAKQVGQTPEQIVQEWLEKRVKQVADDPLLSLAGIFESGVTDVGENHDAYIGKMIRDNDE